MATPLPPPAVGAGALYSPSAALASGGRPPRQPRTSPIAHFASLPNDGIGNDSLKSKLIPDEDDDDPSGGGVPTSGRLLAVNSSYIAYAVKKGLVRVIDRRSASKTLLRGHDEATRLVDAAFFGGDGGSEGVGGVWDDLARLKRRRDGNDNDGAGGGNAGGNNLPPAAASDVLATLGGYGDSSRVLVWRIHSAGEGAGGSLGADKLLEVRFAPAARVAWHPFNPNRFLLLHRNLGAKGDGGEDGGIDGNVGRAVATLVETTRLVTHPHATEGHMVCDCEEKGEPGSGAVVPGMIPLKVFGDDLSLAGANDVAWSNGDARHVLTGHDDGKVRLWDLTATTAGAVAELDVSSENKRVTRVIFLSRYVDSAGSGGAVTPPFLVGTDMNRTVTLWSSFPPSSSGPSGVGAPSRLRVFGLRDDLNRTSVSSMLSLELVPGPYRPPLGGEGANAVVTVPSSFLLMAERASGAMHALHLDTEWKSQGSADGSGANAAVAVKGFDYVSTLNVVHPIYSFCVAPTARGDDGAGDGIASGEERDVGLCCIQSKAVQMLTLSADTCVAPDGVAGGDLAPGLTLLDLPSAGAADDGDEEDENFEEEDFEEEDYDMEEDGMLGAAEYSTNDSGDDDDDDEDDAVPTVTESEPNAFSNWLGAIANPLPPPTTAAPAASGGAPKASPPPGLGFSSILPPPPGMAPAPMAETTIAAMASAAPPPPPAPMAFLSPMQILSGSGSADSDAKLNAAGPVPPPSAPPAPAPPVRAKASSPAPPPGMSSTTAPPPKAAKKTAKKKGRDGSAGRKAAAPPPPKPPTAPMKILQREEPADDGANARSSTLPSHTATSDTAAGTAIDIASVEAAVRKAVAAHMKSHEAVLFDSMREVIAAEVEKTVRSSLKETDKATEQAVQRGIASGLGSGLGNALDSGKLGKRLDKQAREGAASAAKEAVEKMQEPIVNSLHQTMREVMIPAYEAATRQMFQQTSTTLERGLAQISANQTNASAPQLQAMSTQMMKMGETIASLSAEVSQLRVVVNAAGAGMTQNNGNIQQQHQQHGGAGGGPPPPPPMVGIRDEIAALCRALRYEEAFTKAVSANDGNVVLFACKNADSGAIFNGERGVSISQPIMICLMQQLGAVLVTATDAEDIRTILSWLQEIAVTIDPTNTNIQRHVGGVIEQLLVNINNKMSNCNSAFRRPLQTLMQVIRGLL